MEFTEYIKDHVEIVVPALILIGSLLKVTPRIPHWSIPYILGVIGIALCIGLMGFSVDSIIQGIFVTGAAVLLHQYKKQGSEAIKTIKDNNRAEK